MKIRNIDKNLKNNLNESLNQLLDIIENVSEDLEMYIHLNFDNKTIDEEDPLVKLYRSLGRVNCTIDYSEELCDLINYNEDEKQIVLNILDEEIEVAKSVEENSLLDSLKTVRDYIKDVR